MRIKIYQVNMDRDESNLAFMSLDFLQKKGFQQPDAGQYDLVFEGSLPCNTLEDVYKVFNLSHPHGYKARSLSVSDVVEIVEDEKLKSGFYFCDSFGFQEVSFDPSKAQISERYCDLDKVETINVLLVQPGQYPKMVDIEASLEGMQKVVGGDIEEYMPFEDEVAIVCNEEGKMLGLPPNRAVYSEPEETPMTYQEMRKLFRMRENEGGEHLTGYVVFTEDSFDKPYSLAARTYEISSYNKAFMPNMGGYSIFGSALDGSDNHVRLDEYMADEKGGKDGWKVEKCYMLDSPREMIDILCGDFFIAYAPIDSEKFLSLPPDMAEKYKEKFKFPERFIRTNDGIKAIPFKPVSKDMER